MCICSMSLSWLGAKGIYLFLQGAHDACNLLTIKSIQFISGECFGHYILRYIRIIQEVPEKG